MTRLGKDQERESPERAIEDYYSGLSAEEMAEAAAWGEFALSQFPGEDAGAGF